MFYRWPLFWSVQCNVFCYSKNQTASLFSLSSCLKITHLYAIRGSSTITSVNIKFLTSINQGMNIFAQQGKCTRVASLWHQCRNMAMGLRSTNRTMFFSGRHYMYSYSFLMSAGECIHSICECLRHSMLIILLFPGIWQQPPLRMC